MNLHIQNYKYFINNFKQTKEKHDASKEAPFVYIQNYKYFINNFEQTLLKKKKNNFEQTKVT